MFTLANSGVASYLGAASNAADNMQLNGGKLNITGASSATNHGFTLGQNDGTISIAGSATVLTLNGKVTGAGKLIKEGLGRLALSGANDYKGGTVIKAGALALTTDVANISGLGSDTITLQGGSLVMFDSNTTSNTSTWNLSVPKNYAGTLNTDGLSTISGSITGAGTLNYYTNYTGNILASDVSQFTGVISVTTDADGGTFALYNTKGYAGTKINLNNLVTMMYRYTANITIPVGDLTGLSNSVLGAGGTSASLITWEIGSRNAVSTFNGMITNAQYSGAGAVAAIKKVGTGVWTLTNANTYTGGTTINGGTIMVNNTTGSGLGTGAVTVNSGGTLAGTGIVTGAITVNDGGILSPANGAGTFNAGSVNVLSGGILAVDIDKTNAKKDVLNLTGTLSMAGKLQVTALNGTLFAAGDSVEIINGTVTGTPSEIIPATPGEGLEWDLSAFNTSGAIKVKAATGINELELKTKTYPIPCKDFLNIQLDEAVSNLHVSIVSLVGKVVYTNTFDNQTEMKLDVNQLSKGVYLLQLKSDNKSFTQRIIKE